MIMLELNNIKVNYGHVSALKGINMKVEKNQIISLIGSNGAGKTTLLKSISGLVKPISGKILFKNKLLTGVPSLIVKKGIAQVPEGRRIFEGLSVKENLIIGGYLIKRQNILHKRINDMYNLFPLLKERRNQLGGTLSGGEQQMLAICRALMSKPDLLLLDEPSLGLAPMLVSQVFKLIRDIRETGTTILLVEQNAKKSLQLCDYAYVLENGLIILEGEGKNLLKNDGVQKAYLGESKIHHCGN